jgi:hypothetical protein
VEFEYHPASFRNGVVVGVLGAVGVLGLALSDFVPWLRRRRRELDPPAASSGPA